MIHLWNLLYNRFPRQFGTPARVDIKSMSELCQKAQSYCGTTRCFVSVYDYTYQNKTPIIDKSFLDLDPSEPSFYEDALKVSDFMESEDDKHIILFSGGGFHIYTKGTTAGNNKNSLLGYQRYIKEKTHTPIDTSSFGDVARIAGLAYTFNFKRGRYILPLTRKILDSGLENIQNYCLKNNQMDYDIVGKKAVDFDSYLSFIPTYATEKIEFDAEAVKNMKDSLLNALPPCVQAKLVKKELNHDERYFVISCMLEKHWTDEMIKTVLKKYLSDEKYHHCILPPERLYNGKKCEGQLQYIRKKFANPEWTFSSCNKIMEKGWCVAPNCRHHPHDIL